MVRLILLVNGTGFITVYNKKIFNPKTIKMKKNSPYILLLLMSSVFLTISCGKNVDTIHPETIDSVKSILPKQVSWDYDYNYNGFPYHAVNIFSLKYDTANYRIELYEDDTTTSNPYDKLVVAYTYNTDGYIIGFETNFPDVFWLNIFDRGSAKINRDAANKIIYIAYDDKELNEKDTSFYTYQSVSGGINIATSESDNNYLGGKVVYNYDLNHNLLAYHEEDDVNTTYSYNANKSVHKIVSNGYGNTVSDFAYTSGLPDGKEDMLYKLLLGKDYYLLDLKAMYPFTFSLDSDFDDYLISATDPFHISYMKDTYQNNNTIGTDEANLNYEFNGNKLLSKVIFKIIFETNGAEIITMNLKY